MSNLQEMILKAVTEGDVSGLQFLINQDSDSEINNEHLKIAVKNNDLNMVNFLIDNGVRASINPNKSSLDTTWEAIEMAYRHGFTSVFQALKDKSILRGVTDLDDLDYTTPVRLTDEIVENIRMKLRQENNNISVEQLLTELAIVYLTT